MRLLSFFTLSLVLLFSYNTITAQTNIVDNLLQNVAQQEDLNDADIQDYIINNAHTSNRSNLTHYYVKQRVNGIEIYETQSSLHTTEDGTLFKYNSAFLKDVQQKVETSTASLSHIDAINGAIEVFDYDKSVLPEQIEASSELDNGRLYSGGSVSEEAIPIKLMYYLADNGMLRLSYDMSIYEMDHTDWWSLKIDANTGEVVSQINWVVECKFEHDHTDGHQCSSSDKCETVIHRTNVLMPDTYNVYPIPVESPNHGSRTVVTDPANLVASPFGWHDTNGAPGAETTTTRGNNVNTQEDENGNNGTGFAPDGSSNLNFDFPIDFNQAPTVNRDASLTNLFYWNNVIHDVFYQYGFDESAGNFQDNNYGNGGAGSDRVNADGLDGSGTNNANFGTPPDGGNPRMQMFLWSPGSVSITTINSPAAIAGTINGVTAGYGPSTFNVTEDLVLVDDGTASPTEGCNAFINGAAVNGKIALIDRGECNFSVKSLNAQNEGAIAVVVCQNTAQGPFAMGSGAVGGSVTIPSVMISRDDCDIIKAQLPNVSITLNASSTGQEIDGSFDNGIIVHEYGHGISNRLTGGAANANCLSNTEQMGEGWSDYFGMVMTIEPGDMGTDVRGVGTYAITENPSGGGIRDFPYSTDLNTDPRTYDNIQTASVPHGVGSVWCAMLWEVTWALIDEHGFDPDLYNGTGGNNMAMALVTEGLKLQPCTPGFVDGRDAILAADVALYGGQNECLIWNAFAKRGLGINASQGSSNSRADGTESFAIPETCESVEIEKTVDKASVIAGDTLTYTLTFDNKTSTTYTNLVISDTILECMTYVPGSATGGAAFSNNTVSLTVPSVTPLTKVVVVFQVVVDSDITATLEDFIDDAENGPDSWFTFNSGAPLNDGWVIDGVDPFAGANNWFAKNDANRERKTLLLKSPRKLTSNSELRFWHTYSSSTNFAGGRVEMSIDNQETWIDLDPHFTQNGYDDIVLNDPDLPAFGGSNNTGYIETVADLSSFNGEYVYLRFTFFETDSNTGFGWRVDDIFISDIEKSVSNIAYFTAAPGFNEQRNIFPPTDVIPATCSDGIQNGTETGIDTGGACTPTPTGPCEFDLVLDGNLATSDTIFQVENQITSTANVGPNTTYLGSMILLENEFEVELGNEFLAEINPCTSFSNNNEIELKIINTTKVNGKYIMQVDVNIPKSGSYNINLNAEDGQSKAYTAKEMEKGVHRITLKNIKELSLQEIQVIKQ